MSHVVKVLQILHALKCEHIFQKHFVQISSDYNLNDKSFTETHSEEEKIVGLEEFLTELDPTLSDIVSEMKQ